MPSRDGAGTTLVYHVSRPAETFIDTIQRIALLQSMDNFRPNAEDMVLTTTLVTRDGQLWLADAVGQAWCVIAASVCEHCLAARHRTLCRRNMQQYTDVAAVPLTSP